MHRTSHKLPVLLLGLPLLLAGCGAAGAGSQPATTADATPHGYVAGAQENPEPQIGLLSFNQETGAAQLLSLLTEETSDAGTFGPVDAIQQDGRYALVTTQDGVEVFDTGAWTVDHGDHVHYYSSEPGSKGRLPVPDAGTVAGDGKSIAVFSESGGYASIHTHKDLDAGSLAESLRITTTPHEGLVVPYEGHYIASIAGSAGAAPGGIEVRDGKDRAVLGRQDCPGLSAHATTRAGVVLACTDGALLIAEDGGTFAGEKIPYPDGGGGLPPATSLEHRPGSNELAGPAGDAGVWHLNVSKRVWTLLKTPVPAVAASAVGDTKRVLALCADGSLMTLNPATGEVSAQAPMLAPLSATGTLPQLRIDAARAYLVDPAGSAVHEIDYAEGLRTARTFGVPAADIVLETGL